VIFWIMILLYIWGPIEFVKSLLGICINSCKWILFLLIICYWCKLLVDFTNYTNVFNLLFQLYLFHHKSCLTLNIQTYHVPFMLIYQVNWNCIFFFDQNLNISHVNAKIDFSIHIRSYYDNWNHWCLFKIEF